jgi:hypothetical protein
LPPVIFITAYDEPESRSLAEAAGAAASFASVLPATPGCRHHAAVAA